MDDTRRRYEFEGFTLDQASWTLTDPAGAPVGLTPKAFDALVYFLEHRGEVIGRETLLRELWPTTVVEENNLRQVVAAIRRAVGDRLIETVPRRGYRFVGDVRAERIEAAPEPTRGSADRASHADPASHADRAPLRRRLLVPAFLAALIVAVVVTVFWRAGSDTTEAGTDPPPRLAVLPFVDTSPEGDLEQAADAIAMELLTTLSLIEGLDVVGSTSSFYFKDRPVSLPAVQELLGVDYVLEGDVRSADERLRISVRLVEAGSGSQIWSESYDRRVDDLFAVQDEIARKTAQALEITLGVGALGVRLGTTRNADAFFAFVEGSRILREGYRFSPADVRRAIPHFERAVALDDEFAVGWFELYSQWRWLHILTSDAGAPAPGALERAEQALRRVETLTPNLPELVLSKLETSADAHEIARALEALLGEATNMGYPLPALYEIEATYLRFTGRLGQATTTAERARVLDPLNPRFTGLIADGYSAEGRHREALALIDEFAAAGQAPPGLAGTALVIALESGTRDEIDARVAALAGSSSSITREMARNLDDPTAALRALREFVSAPDETMVLWPTLLAPWAAYFGDDALALEMYRHEVPFAAGNTISRPIFRGMRQLPEFKTLVRDIGLLSYWRESGHWPDYCRMRGRDDFECF